MVDCNDIKGKYLENLFNLDVQEKTFHDRIKVENALKLLRICS